MGLNSNNSLNRTPANSYGQQPQYAQPQHAQPQHAQPQHAQQPPVQQGPVQQAPTPAGGDSIEVLQLKMQMMQMQLQLAQAQAAAANAQLQLSSAPPPAPPAAQPYGTPAQAGSAFLNASNAGNGAQPGANAALRPIGRAVTGEPLARLIPKETVRGSGMPSIRSSLQATVAARGWGNLISQGTLNRTVDALADHDPSALRGARFGKDPMGMVLSNALAKNILVEDDRGGGATEGRAIHAKLKPIVDMMNGISCGGDVGSYKTSTTGKSVPDQLNQILDEHFFHAANFSQPLNIIITTNFQLDKKQKGQVKDALLAAKNFGHGEQAVQLRIIQTGTPGTKEYKNAKAASDGLDDGEKKFGIKESSKKSVKDMVDATAADRSVEAGDVSKLASYTAEDHLAKMIAVDPRADKKG